MKAFPKMTTFYLLILFLLQSSCASFQTDKNSANSTPSIIEVSSDIPKVEIQQQNDGTKAGIHKKSTHAKSPSVQTQEPKATEAPTPNKKSETVPSEIVARPDCIVEIAGDSTLKKYSSRATVLGLRVSVFPPIGKLEDLLNEKLTEFVLVVPVAGLKSGNNTLDEHLREALKEDKFREIHGAVTSYNNHGRNPDGSYKVTAQVNLDIAGKTVTVPVDATLKVEGRDLRIKGQKQLLMTDFDIRPPTLMMGAIKTANEITIRFDFLLGLKNNGEQSHNHIQGTL